MTSYGPDESHPVHSHPAAGNRPANAERTPQPRPPSRLWLVVGLGLLLALLTGSAVALYGAALLAGALVLAR